MVTTILIVSLSICVILLSREIIKLQKRVDVLNKETNTRISVTDQRIHLRINNESKLLQSNIDEVESDLVNLINQRLDEEMVDMDKKLLNIKNLIPPTNDELLERIKNIEEQSYRMRMNM